MPDHKVVPREEWLAQRRAFLQREKAFTQQREELAQARRALPWVKIDTDYCFDSTEGEKTLADLFGGFDQLLLYHFMFGPDWQQGCPSCSFWADNYNAALPHLEARNIKLVVVSRAGTDKLQAYRERMGWAFDWVSSAESDFNFDFGVSFEPEDNPEKAPNYNFGNSHHGGDEAPGLSVFYREGEDIYHTYSCYARGLDMLNGTYQHIDLAPRGRDEADLPFTMAWVRRHDEYV